MALKNWQKVINSKMGAYSLDKGNYDILEFSNGLSPLTEFSLDFFANIIPQKNVIINFPDFKLSPASLYAYIFAEKYDKNVYILADEKGDSLNSRSKVSLNKNHYLLCDYEGYVFRKFPVFYLKKIRNDKEDYQNNSIDYKLTLERYLPRSDNRFKRTYTEKNVLKNPYVSKFIIDTDSNLFGIKEKLNIALKNNDEHLNPKEHPIGLIIIENADRFFRSYGRLESFITWFKELDSDVKLLIHFNNPSIDYIKILIKELNFAVLPFNRYILQNNNYLKSNSHQYFSNIDESELELVSRYNLDSDIFINQEVNLSIYDPLIYSGSIDMFFSNAYSTFKKIDIDNVYDENSLHKARELLFDLYNLTVNPSYLNIPFKINNGWTRSSIPHFIQNYKSKLFLENPKNRFFIYNFLDSLTNMYYELANCKRVNEDLSYSRECKDYVLYDLLGDFYLKNQEVFIGTYLDSEPNILKEVLEKGYYIKKDLFVPINMKMLTQKPDSEKENKILILPGVIPEVFTSELFKPYKEIIILSYEGNNHRFLKEQLDKVIYGNILEEKEYMDILKETLELFDAAEDNEILDDFNKRFELIEFEEEEEKPEEESGDDLGDMEDIETSEYDPFHIDLNLKDYMSEWSRSKSNLNIDLSKEINQRNYDTIPFRLQNIQTNEFVEKKLPVNKSYLTFDNIYHIDDAKELKPSELKNGDYIIIIDNDEKKSLLNLVIDSSELKSQINMSLVEYWKLEFLNYVESNNLKYSEVYNIYCNRGGDKTYQTVMQWCKGEAIGPQSAYDLYIIGDILDNIFIMDNYQSIFQQISLVRTSHRLIGRKLKKMIKSILTDEYLDVSSLNDREYLIYENIQNGIYKIV